MGTSRFGSAPISNTGLTPQDETSLQLPTLTEPGDWFLAVQAAEVAEGWPWRDCSIGRRVEGSWVDSTWVEPACPEDLAWPAAANPDYHAWIRVE